VSEAGAAPARAALLERIRVVLVESTHPGNVGGVARAMKTMGLKRLVLVNPSRYPSAEATARAAGADDVLYDAAMVDTLDEALAGCDWAVATSARPRSLGWPELDPRTCAEAVLGRAAVGEVALVFGRENSGLSNRELDRCQALVRIPTDPAFRSLNLAAAVQLLAWEIRVAAGAAGAGEPSEADRPATVEELEGLYAHLERALVTIGYLDPDKPKKLMRRLRRLYARARLERAELDILRGILRAAERTAARAGATKPPPEEPPER